MKECDPRQGVWKRKRRSSSVESPHWATRARERSGHGLVLGLLVQGGIAVVVLQVIDPPAGVGPGVLVLVSLGAGSTGAGLGPPIGVESELEPLGVGMARERLDATGEPGRFRLDGAVVRAADLPAVVQVQVDITGVAHPARDERVSDAPELGLVEVAAAGQLVPAVPAHGRRSRQEVQRNGPAAIIHLGGVTVRCRALNRVRRIRSAWIRSGRWIGVAGRHEGNRRPIVASGGFFCASLVFSPLDAGLAIDPALVDLQMMSARTFLQWIAIPIDILCFIFHSLSHGDQTNVTDLAVGVWEQRSRACLRASACGSGLRGSSSPRSSGARRSRT